MHYLELKKIHTLFSRKIGKRSHFLEVKLIQLLNHKEGEKTLCAKNINVVVK
jgi:hypothetical protein